MSRGVLKLIVWLVALGGLIALGAAVHAAFSGRLHATVRNVLAQELARATKREVQVGRVSGDLLRGVRVDHLAMGAKEGLAHGTEVVVQRVTISYDLLAVLRGEISAPASIKRIVVQGAYARVDLAEDAFADLVKPRPPDRIPPERKFQPRIIVRDSVVDLVGPVAGRQLATRLVAVNGQVDLHPVGPMAIEVSARSGDGTFTRLNGRALSQGEERFLLAEGRLEGLNLERLAALLPPGAPRLRGGSASVDFGFWQVPRDGNTVGPLLALLEEGEKPPERKRDTGFRADLTAHRVSLEVPGEPGGLLRIPEAVLSVTPQGAQVRALRAEWQGVPIRAEGWVYDFSAPRADLIAEVDRVDLATLRALVPQVQSTALPPGVSGLTSVTVEIVGPLEHLNARLAAQLPQGARLELPEAELDLGPAVLEAQLWDLAQPAVLADVSSGAVQVVSGLLGLPAADLSSALDGPAPLGEAHTPPPSLALRQVAEFRAQWLSAGGQVVSDAAFHGVEATWEGREVSVRGGRLSWSGNHLRLSGVEAEVAGGRVEVEAFARLPLTEEGQLELVAQGQAYDLDLAQLPEAWWGGGEARPSGRLNAHLGGAWQGDSGQAAVRFDLREAAWGDTEVGEGEGLALVEFAGGELIHADLPLLHLTTPAGEAWAHGELLPGGRVDLTAELGGVDLARLPGLAAERRVEGRAYGRVQLLGTLTDPELSAELAVFGARYDEYEASALVVELWERPRREGVESTLAGVFFPLEARLEAYVSYDTAVAHLQTSLSPAPSEWEAPGLDGDLRVTGVRLPVLARFAEGDWTRQPLEGLAQLQVKLGGTTMEPWARGELQVSNARYGDHFIDALRAPLYLGPDEEGLFFLAVERGRLDMQGAQLAFEARVDDVFARDRTFVAEGRGTGIRLERLAFLRDNGWPVGGEVHLPRLIIRGDHTGITGEGRVIGDDLVIGRSPVGGLDTTFAIAENHLRLPRTVLHAAGGRVEATLEYDLAQRELEGQVALEEVDVARLLRLVGPLAAAASPAEERARRENQWLSWSVRTGGRLSATAQLQGPVAALSAQTTVDLQQAYYEDKPLPEARGQFRVELGDRSVRDVDMELQTGEALVVITGEAELEGEVALTADASSVDLAGLRDWIPPRWGLAGVAGITVVARGPAQEPEVTASVEVSFLRVQGVSFDLLQIPVVRVADGQANIEEFILKRGEREIRGRGALPFSWDPPGVPMDQPVALQAKLENTDLSFFPPLLQELARGQRAPGAAAQREPLWAGLSARGVVDAELNLTGTLSEPLLSGFTRLQEGAVNLEGWPHPLEDLTVDLRVEGVGGASLVQVEEVRGRWHQTEFRVDGEARLAGFSAARRAENTYDLRLAVTAEREEPVTGMALADLDGLLRFATQPGGEHLLQVERFSARMGEGSLALSGRVQVAELATARLAYNPHDLRVEFKQAQVGYQDLFRGHLEGALELANPAPGEPAELTGRLALSRATFGLPRAGEGPPGELRALGAGFPAYHLAAQVVIGEEVWFRTPGFSAPLVRGVPALRLAGTPQQPVISGRAELDPTQAAVMSADFRLSSGQMEYRLAPAPGVTAIPAPLQLRAEYSAQATQIIPSAVVNGRPIGMVRLSVSIAGALPSDTNGPTVVLVSDPPLTEEQKLALLGWDPLALEGTPDVSQMLSEQFMSLLALGVRQAIFSPLEEELRRGLGLTEFRVVFAFDQPLEVRLGKLLWRDLLVSYRYSLVGDRTELWDLGLSYDLPGLRVTFSTNESGDNQFRISHSWTF